MLFALLLAFLPLQSASTIESVSLNLQKRFNYNKESHFLLVNIEKQEMYLVKNDAIEKTYRISTSKYGIGSKQGSNKTPLGIHRLAEKIGKDAKPNTIFVGRKDTKELAAIITDSLDIQADDVTSRILWLEGMEPGVNKGKGIDSHQRYIYIHGTPEEGLIGTPASHGCIRMYNKDVIELFELVKDGTLVVVKKSLTD